MSKTLEELFKDVIAEPQKEFDWGEKEYIARLEKALDKACDYLTYLANQSEEVMFEDGSYTTDKEFWKEYLLNGTN